MELSTIMGRVSSCGQDADSVRYGVQDVAADQDIDEQTQPKKADEADFTGFMPEEKACHQGTRPTAEKIEQVQPVFGNAPAFGVGGCGLFIVTVKPQYQQTEQQRVGQPDGRTVANAAQKQA